MQRYTKYYLTSGVNGRIFTHYSATIGITCGLALRTKGNGVTLMQETGTIVSESTNTVARSIDELYSIYDAACKKYEISNEALSGRAVQEMLFHRTRLPEMPDLMDYLLKKGVAVRYIITSIKCATPELRKEALALRIAQHEEYERQQSTKVVEPSKNAAEVKKSTSTMPLFHAPFAAALG